MLFRSGRTPSRARRSLQFDGVALRVGDVDGRPFAFRAVARLDRPRVRAARLEIALDARGVEGFDAKEEMIEIATLSRRRRATGAAELSVHGHEVDERTT